MHEWIMFLPEVLAILIIITIALNIRKQKDTEKGNAQALSRSIIALAILYVPVLIVSIYCLLTSNPHLKTWRFRTTCISVVITIIYIFIHRLKNRH